MDAELTPVRIVAAGCRGASGNDRSRNERPACGCSISARFRARCDSSRDCSDVDALIDAIRSLAVRGAPALGAAGAYGVALAAHTLRTRRQVRAAAARSSASRPTAVNLATGVAFALEAYEAGDAASALAAARDLARERRRAQPGAR